MTIHSSYLHAEAHLPNRCIVSNGRQKEKGGSLVASPFHLTPHFLQNVGAEMLLRCNRDQLHRLSNRCTLHPGASPMQRQQPLITGRQYPHITPLAGL